MAHEPALRAEFAEAASGDHRPASQVLRGLMRDHVRRVGARDLGAANDAIPASPRFEREDAVRFGRASVALEGCAAWTPPASRAASARSTPDSITRTRFPTATAEPRGPSSASSPERRATTSTGTASPAARTAATGSAWPATAA
ncbi:hypothetical protein NF681_03295 (plasmid) [Comamonadaceae bacterium OTU4NAUVB1]|nr:hypothetical protein NF681_03295 [Comamonadaceae bacterium OTU4NAUVB1]